MANDKLKEKEDICEQKNSQRAGKGRNSRSRRNNNRTRNDDYKGNKPNDISWHAKSKQLLSDAACIPWSYSAGRTLNRQHRGTGSRFGAGNFRTPGVLAVRTVITPGTSTNPSDAINVAAQALYTDIRSQLKSANAYDSSDVMIYMTGMAEIKACIAFIRRILGTSLNYSFMNSYLPDALIRAQGVGPVSLHKDFARYRSRANQIIAKASQIWWPKGFDYVTRAEWEYSNYYTEGQSIKDQIYMFTPGLFRKFTYDASRDYAGMLEPCIKFSVASPHTMDEVLDALSDMIDAIVGDTDFQNIAGDLFNRYGASGVETFSLIPEAYIINPVFSFEVLEQIQNARCLTAVNQFFNQSTIDNFYPMFQIKQDPVNNILIVDNSYVYVTDVDGNIGRMITDLYDQVLSVDKDPSDEKTMLITRCANTITSCEIVEPGAGETNVSFNFTFDAAMELVVSFDLISLSVDGNVEVYSLTSSQVGLAVDNMCKISNFHYFPFITFGMVTSAGAYRPSITNFGSVDTYAVISPEQLKDMNRVDLMSLFAVPNVGKVNG